MPYVYSHQALSGEGRAAKSLRTASVDDRSRWIHIQLNTFTNWSNEQLGRLGPPITDLGTDFSDGTRLIALVEALQKRTCTGKIYRNNPSEIQMLMNVQMALDALREDGVKLVNIGSHDIVEGNMKLILGLVWCLILRYQIASRTKIPPRKLMLAWIQAVLPELKISNFRTNWNDGKALSALLDYCQPGVFVHWRQLSSRDALNNCRRALQVAQAQFAIPQVVSPEDLSSPDLDELSCMTYISYFMKRDGPGYRATLNRVNQLIPEARVADFQRTWNDGLALCHLVHSVGGRIPGWPNLRFDPTQWMKNLHSGLMAAMELGLKPMITAKEMVEPDVEHLGVMVLAAELCGLPAVERSTRTHASPSFDSEPNIEETSCHIHQQVNLDLAFADGHEVSLSDLDAVVVGPDGTRVDEQTVQLLKTLTIRGAVVSLVPPMPGPYEVRIFCLGKELPSSPVRLNVLRAPLSVGHSSPRTSQPPTPSPPPPILEHHSAPSERHFDDDDLVAMPPPPTLMNDYYSSSRGSDIGQVSFSGLSEPCSIGSIVEVVINAHGDSTGTVLVEAAAPSGRLHKCQVLQKGNAFTATFTPNEVGEWQIGILYDSEHIRGSPFSCFVYDANLVQVYGLDVGLVGQELKFNVNTVQAGEGSIKVSVLHHGRVIPNTVDEQGAPGSGLYRVQFTPDGAGQYKIHVLFNNMEVKGSPFILDIADASSVSVYGDNLRMASVDKLSTFMIHAVGADSKDITVSITAPSGKKKRARVVPIGDSAYRVEWKPVEAGEHYIDVRLYNQSVHDSPFTCNVGDPDMVTVRNMPSQIKASELGQDITFEIDASAAGSGNLEIMINGGRVACKVRELGGRLYLAAFAPTQPVTHVIEMRFNGDPVKSSPWRIEFAHGSSGAAVPSQQQQATYVLAPLNAMPGGVFSPYDSSAAMHTTTMTTIERETEQASYAEISGVGLQRACVGKVASFDVGGQGLRSGDIDVKLTSPSGAPTPSKVIASRTGDYRCEYVPTEVGAYRMEITIGGQRIDGSPFYVNAYAPHKVYIDPIPGGAVGKPVQFYVDANEAGKGQLEISVNQGRVPNNVQMQGSGRCLVTFIPQEAGTYVIDVTFNNELVRGCPVRVEITQKQLSTLTGGDIKSISPLTTHSTYSSSRTIETSGAASSTIPRASTLMREETSTRRSPMSPPTPASPTMVRHAQQLSSDKTDRTDRVSKDTPRSFVMVQRHQFEHGSGEKMDTTITSTGSDSDRVFATSVPRPWASPKDTRKTFATDTSPRSQTFISSTRAVTHTRPYGDTSRASEPTSGTEETPAKTGKYEMKTSPSGDSQLRSSSVREWYDSRQKAYEEPASTTGLRSVTDQSTLKTDEVGGMTVASYGISRDEKASPPSKSTPLAYSSSLENRSKSVEQSTPLSYSSNLEKRAASVEQSSPLAYSSNFENRSKSVEKSPDVITKPSQDYTFKEIETKRPREEAPIETSGVSVKSIKTTYEQLASSQHAPMDDEPERNRETRPIRTETTDYSRGQDTTDVAMGDDQPDYAYRGMSTFDASAMRREGPEKTSFVEYTGKHAELPQEPYERPSDGFGRSKVTTYEEEANPTQSAHVPPFYRTQSTVDEQKSLESPGVTEELRKKHELKEIGLEEPSQRTAEYMRAKDEDERHFERMGFTTAADIRKTSSSSRSSSKSGGSIEESKKEDRKVTPPTMTTSRAAASTSVVRSQQPEGELSPATQRRLQEQSLRKASDLRESDIPITTQLGYDSQPSLVPPKSPALSHKTKQGKPFDFGKSKFTTKHEVIKRGKDVEVKLEHLKLSKEELKVIVMVPTKSREKNELVPKVKKVRNGYEITFTPTEVGTHKIIASVNDSIHPHSPFPIRVYDSAEIDIGTIPNKCSLGEAVEFTVDAGRAGFGNLEIAIKDSEGVIIPSHVSQIDEGTAKFLVTFSPAQAGLHTVNITFNKEMLKSSPFEVEVIDEPRSPPVTLAHQTTTVMETTNTVVEERRQSKTAAAVPLATIADFPSMARVRSPTTFVVATKGAAGKLSLSATGPDGDRASIKVVDEDDEMKKVEFVPKTVGDHSIEVKFADMDVRGSPFTCRVYDPAKIRVGDIPNGLVDKPVHFIVDASEGGVGNLEVAVNEGRVPSMAHSLGQHRYDISFVPRDSDDYTISIRFNNDPVPGSPFTCKILSSVQVTATGPGLERVPVGKATHFNITVQDGNKGPPPVVNVVDPHGERLKIALQKIPSEGSSAYDDSFQVEYTPQSVGNHQIEIDYAGEPISGSPFTAKAYDAKCAKLYPVEGCAVGRPATFIIDAARAGAGNMEIIVSVDGRNVPNFVQAEGQAKFKVSFTPQEAKEHVVSVRFNGEAIPGSPMKCAVNAEDGKAAKTIGLAGAAKDAFLVGEVSEGLANEIKGFVVQTGGRQGDCNVVVTAPSGLAVDTIAHDVENGIKFKFKPMEVGRHQIEVTLGDEPIKGSPFSMQVVDLELVRVSKIPSSAVVGRRYVFDIDTALAGEGRVRVEAKTEDDRLVPVELEKVDAVVYRASFRPREAGKHRIAVLLNDSPVAEAAVVRVIDATKCASVSGDGLKSAQVDRTAAFTLTVEKGLGNELAVFIVGPTGQSVPCRLHRESSEVYRADWQPKEVGEHRVSVTVADAHIPSSPFTVNVLDLSAVRVIGLKDDRVGVEQRFNVDSSSAGNGVVTVRVSRQGETLTHEMRMVKEGLHVCTFTPSRVGVHKVHVYLDGVALPECPYECDIHDTASVRAHGDALQRAQNGKTSRFEVSMANAGRGELDVVISDPSGGPVPVKCYRQQDDSFWVEFTPQEIGTHTIEVTFADAPIAGSPFRSEVVDPKRVKIIAPTTPLVLRQEANIKLNRQGAGKGELSVEVTDPNGSLVPIDTLRSPSGDDRISFLPTKLGEHKVNVKMAGFQVQGSPQTLVVEEAGRPRAFGSALDNAVQVGKVASMTFDSKKTKGGLKVEVKGPKNKVKHTTSKKTDGVFEISFTPQEVGDHQVAISWNDKAISGSPFSVAVVDAEKVELSRDNLDSRGNLVLTVFQRKEIDIDATMAGPGKLRAEVRGPNGTLIPGVQTQSLGYGKYRVTLVPRDSGEHSLFLYWSDLPVTNANPLIGWAESDSPILVASTSRASAAEQEKTQSKERLNDDELADHLRVVLKGEGLTRASTKEPAEFIVDGSDAEQDVTPACRLMGQKADVPVRLTPIGNRIYKATYTPLIAGKYELEVLWEGRQVRGSPFRVEVAAVGEADNILVDAESLRLGIVHDEVKTTIDTRRAGPGQLSAQCMGPSKLAYCELYDHRDGTYTLCIRPSEVGKHTLVVKYSGEHAPGSPFTVNVSHPPDPSKVRVYGPGVEHGILSRFKSNFVVETKGAGAGQLTVRVRGPKGAFNVEMQRERKQDRTIHCKYEPREPGDYQVEVKWHGEHVPGSPFFVMIFDTQQELERFLSGQPPSPQPPTPFVPPGWIGPPPAGVFLPPGAPPPIHGHPPMLALPPPPTGPPMFPQHGMPYNSSTLHSVRSSRAGGKKQTSNGY